MLERPAESAYDPYYDLYIGQVPEGNVIACMGSELAAMLELLRATPTVRETYRYAE